MNMRLIEPVKILTFLLNSVIRANIYHQKIS